MAGGASEADDGARRYALPAAHLDAREMTVERPDLAAMVNDDRSPVPAAPPSIGDGSSGGCSHRRPGPGDDVDTGVRPRPPERARSSKFRTDRAAHRRLGPQGQYHVAFRRWSLARRRWSNVAVRTG